MKGVLINRNKDNESKPGDTKNSHEFIFVFPATHKNSQQGGGNH
jgi:hypothetical protein